MFRNAAGLAQDHERYSSKAPLVALVLDIAIRDVIVRKRYPVFLRVVASIKYFVHVSTAFLELGHQSRQLVLTVT